MKESYATAALAGIFGIAILAGGITSYNGRTYVSPAAGSGAVQSAQAAPAAQRVDFVAAIQPVLDESCVMCHQGEYAAGNLNLDAEHTPASLIGVTSSQAEMPLVSPGEPDESYLLHKLKGTHETAGGFGSQMPMGGTLSDDQIGLVSDWISGLQ